MPDEQVTLGTISKSGAPDGRRPWHSTAMGTAVIAAGLALIGFGLLSMYMAPANAQEAGEVQVAQLTGGEIAPIPIRPPLNAPMSFADLVERVSPAVVSVTVQLEAPDFSEFSGGPGIPFPFDRFPGIPRGPQGPQGPQQGPGGPGRPGGGVAQGSGFAISGDGHIVTNNHVVENGVSFSVTLADGTELEAELIGTDPATDLAVLRVQPDEPLPYVTFAQGENLRVGDWVVAVGNPFGLGGTVTAGIVSARGRDLNNTAYNEFIQIDAPINSGNSGGPTFDLQGRVIGVNTLIFSPSGGNVGIGFAIPASTAASVVEQIIDHGNVRRGWLGIQIQPVTEDVAASLGMDEAQGAIVVQVIENTPAAAAGFEQGDVVLKVNGEAVEDNRDLTRRVGALRPGENTTFVVLRDGRERTIHATLDLREELVAEADVPDLPGGKTGIPPEAQVALPGVTVIPSQDGTGVSVVAVEPNSEASDKGLRPGSVIVSISGEPVSTPAEVVAYVEAAQAEGRSAVLLLLRDGVQERFVALRLETDEG